MSKHLEGKDHDPIRPEAGGQADSPAGSLKRGLQDDGKTADLETPCQKVPGDDGELVLAARKGELAAFDRLVKRYQRKATAVAFRLLNNLDDALEVTQDAFLNAYGKLNSLSEPERFGSWLLRIVSNLALNRRRARTLRKTASLDAGSDEQDGRADMDIADEDAIAPDEAASAEDVRGIIDQALAELPEMQRQALVLFSVEHMPQKEVAQVLGCSVEAVKWHVFTARKKLKDRLKDYL